MSLYISKANQCKFIVASLYPTLITVNPVSGDNNGVITVVVTGGQKPYQYSINRGALQSSNQFTGLSEGTYLIQVVDKFGKIGYASTKLFDNVNCGTYSGATWADIHLSKWGEFANCIWSDFN